MALHSPPVPFVTKQTLGQAFSTVSDAVTSPKGSAVLSVSVGALDALQNVLESVNTLPCIKYIRGISIKLVQIVQASSQIVIPRLGMDLILQLY